LFDLDSPVLPVPCGNLVVWGGLLALPPPCGLSVASALRARAFLTTLVVENVLAIILYPENVLDSNIRPKITELQVIKGIKL
jgi:hypothetical protein